MEYRKFINDAPDVSVIGIGAWQLGESKDWESMTDKESEELIQKSLQLGINFFDTAPNYGYGTSETRLGNALKNVKREEIVINTKFGTIFKIIMVRVATMFYYNYSLLTLEN